MDKNKELKVYGTSTLEDSLRKVRELSETNRIVLDSFYTAKNILNHLAKLRKESGLSQRDLAKLTGMKQPQIARYEKHKEYPRLDTFLRILDALNYNIELQKKNEVSSKQKSVELGLSK